MASGQCRIKVLAHPEVRCCGNKAQEVQTVNQGTKLVKRNTKGTVEWILPQSTGSLGSRTTKTLWKQGWGRNLSLKHDKYIKSQKNRVCLRHEGQPLLNCSVNFVSPRGSVGPWLLVPRWHSGSYCTGMPKHISWLSAFVKPNFSLLGICNDFKCMSAKIYFPECHA